MTDFSQQPARGSKTAWIVAFATVLVFTALKAVGPVIPYPATFFLLTYQEGFIKRGLVGTLLSAGDGPVSAWHINLIAFCILAMLLVAFVVLSARMISRHHDLAPLALLFASSIGVVYLCNIAGYFDHILLLLAMLAILPSGTVPRILLTFILGCIAILVHEAAALMVLPLMYFAILLSAPRVWSVPLIAGLLGVVGVHVALTLYFAFFSAIDSVSADRLQAAAQARAGFQLEGAVFDVLSRLPGAEITRTQNSVNLVAQMDSLIIVAPALVPLLWACGMTLRRMQRGIILSIALLLACLSPAALRFIATDIHRWDAITVCTTFLTLHLVQRELPKDIGILPRGNWVAPVFLVLLVVSASSTSFLLGGGDLRLYPFFEIRKALIDMM